MRTVGHVSKRKVFTLDMCHCPALPVSPRWDHPLCRAHLKSTSEKTGRNNTVSVQCYFRFFDHFKDFLMNQFCLVLLI